MHSFLFLGNGPYVNKGCEAIVRGTLAIFKLTMKNEWSVNNVYFSMQEDSSDTPHLENLENVIINRLVDNRKSSALTGRIKTTIFKKKYIMNKYKKLIPLITKADIVFSLGGDNFTLDYGLPSTHLELNRLVAYLKKPLVLWGCSLGPFDKINKNSMKIFKNIQNSASLVVAREFITTMSLVENGFDKNKIVNTLDPAFYMESKEIESEEIKTYLENNKVIGINLSPIMGNYVKRIDFNWVESAKEMIQEISQKTGMKILMLPHVNKPGNNDYYFMNSLRLESDRVHLLKPVYSADELKSIISKCQLFIGCRTHSTIASMASFVPTISIGYSMKARGLNQLIFDSDQYLVDMDSYSLSRLMDSVTLCLNENTSIREYLEKRINSLKCQDGITLKNLFSSLYLD